MTATIPPLVSVVIPALNEERGLGDLLRDLGRLTVPRELIVVDGGSRDASVSIAERGGAAVMHSARGRGVQLALGARAARAPLLCFLHADVRADSAVIATIDRLARDGTARPVAFRLRIDAPGACYRVIERAANTRSRWLGLPYGDQGLIVTRAHYDAAGGYPEVPLMEDVSLVRALARVAPVTLVPEALRVSARRWERDGVARRTMRNWRLLAAYYRGVPLHELARRY